MIATLPEFRLETYLGRWEFAARHHLTASDAQTLSVGELLDLGGDEDREAFERLALSYTPTWGSAALLEAVAATYDKVEPEHVLTFAGAEEAMFWALQELVGPGDHAVVTVPNYQSMETLTIATGADVDGLVLRPEERWALDLDALERLLRPETRLVAVNFPNNPTGAVPDAAAFRRLVDLCEERGIRLFSDEVYRGLELDPAATLPQAADLSPSALSLNVMSKAYGLPGLRIGWLACHDRALLERLERRKHYTSICNSGPSEHLATIALRAADRIRARNRDIVAANLPVFDAFFSAWPEQSRGSARRAAASRSPACSPASRRARSAGAWSRPRESSSFPPTSTAPTSGRCRRTASGSVSAGAIPARHSRRSGRSWTATGEGRRAKAGMIAGSATFTVKLATGFYGNAARGLPSSGGALLVGSARTGEVLAVLDDEGWLTAARTAAAAALATDALAPPGSLTLGIIGTGVQAGLALEWLRLLRPVERVLVAGRRPVATAALARRIEGAAAVAPSEVLAQADAIVTATASTEPLFSADEARPGVHFTALGADMPGKQELPAALFENATVVVDDIDQAMDHGDLAHAARAGTASAAAAWLLGDVLRDRLRGPAGATTIADLTGVGALDAAVADAVLAAGGR